MTRREYLKVVISAHKKRNTECGGGKSMWGIMCMKVVYSANGGS